MSGFWKRFALAWCAVAAVALALAGLISWLGPVVGMTVIVVMTVISGIAVMIATETG